VLARIDRRAQEHGVSRSAYLALADDTQAPGVAQRPNATAATKAERDEAFNAGYAAAMQEIREFAERPAAAAMPAAPPQRQRRVQAKSTPPRRTRRGDNARHIVEVMMILPDHTGPAAAIKKVLAEKGRDIHTRRSDMDSGSYKLVTR
jgi:hypothetical protein